MKERGSKVEEERGSEEEGEVLEGEDEGGSE